MDEKMNTDKGRTAAGVKGNLNVGHGHVIPRPDGVRARCGGPAICPECALDLGRRPAPSPPASACARCANGRLLGKCPDCGKECMQDWQPASTGATPKSMHIAEAVVSELQGRSGFDATWDSLDDDIRQEVLDAISEILVANVAGINQPSPPAPAVVDDYRDCPTCGDLAEHQSKCLASPPAPAGEVSEEMEALDYAIVEMDAWITSLTESLNDPEYASALPDYAGFIADRREELELRKLHLVALQRLRTHHAADVAALRDQLQAGQCAEQMSSDIAKDQAKEIVRLREGLGSIAKSTCCGSCQEAALVARAALQGEKT